MSGPTSPDDDAEAGAGTPDELAGADFPSQAYSAPESEHITIAPYVPADTDLYDYDSYRHEGADDRVGVAGPRPPRWPWVVGVTAIIAAITLVVSVALLVTKRDTTNLAMPSTSTTPSAPPVQDEITTTVPPRRHPDHHRGTATATAPAAAHRDGDRDARTATAPAGDHRGAAPTATRHHRATAPAADHAGRAAPGDLLGHRHQGAGRHHLDHLHRRLGPAAHAT